MACLLCAGILWLDLALGVPFNPMVALLCCCGFILMGSATSGIPIGALVATSPFKIFNLFCVGSYEDDTRDANEDEEVLGKL